MPGKQWRIFSKPITGYLEAGAEREENRGKGEYLYETDPPMTLQACRLLQRL